MSTYPCEVHGTTVNGSLDGFYMNMKNNDSRWFRKIRLCREHAIEFLELHAEDWRMVHPMYGVSFLEQCARCHAPYDSGSADCRMFVDIYLRGEAKVTYVSQFCISCALVVVDALALVLEDTSQDRDRLAVARSRYGQPRSDHGRENGEASGVLGGVRGRKDHPKTANDHGQSD